MHICNNNKANDKQNKIYKQNRNRIYENPPRHDPFALRRGPPLKHVACVIGQQSSQFIAFQMFLALRRILVEST